MRTRFIRQAGEKVCALVTTAKAQSIRKFNVDTTVSPSLRALVSMMKNDFYYC